MHRDGVTVHRLLFGPVARFCEELWGRRVVADRWVFGPARAAVTVAEARAAAERWQEQPQATMTRPAKRARVVPEERAVAELAAERAAAEAEPPATRRDQLRAWRGRAPPLDEGRGVVLLP